LNGNLLESLRSQELLERLLEQLERTTNPRINAFGAGIGHGIDLLRQKRRFVTFRRINNKCRKTV